MNDPHVVALHYNIDHHPSIAFDKAKPVDHRETAFDVCVFRGHPAGDSDNIRPPIPI